MNPGDRPTKTSTPILVKLAHASAPFLSTFLLIHLSAPILANVGGSNLSSNLLLLGREYYQTPFGEKYLLLTPFAIHVASGIARRLFAPPSKQPRRLTSPLSLAGYTALVFLPIHVFTHRLAPTDASAPISAVGPAELDYEFVKTGLSRFPWRSWVLYSGLVVSVLVHAVEGANIIRASWVGTRLSSRTRRVIAGAVSVPVMLGLWTLSREPLMALSSTVERYSACLTSLWVYRV
ncbi:hypothetical protein J3R82DRAFT_5135 [Butyriboletus roseoflavus]|nr:hypothetical protein J3R82DRAFT_5135 [Butyriboletus roseoflavus]